MTATTYSLEEVAAQVLPSEWTDSVRWLARRLNRGELSGYRVGRVWRMTETDVDYLLEKHHNLNAAPEVCDTVPASTPAGATSASFREGLSDRSRRRLRSAS